MPGDNSVQPVDVRNFDMSFGRMVWFMVKWAFATIPALIILIAIGFFALSVLSATFNRASLTPSETRTLKQDAYEPQATVEAEIARAQGLLATGRHMEAYGLAHATSQRPGISRKDKELLQALEERAWHESQKPTR